MLIENHIQDIQMSVFQFAQSEWKANIDSASATYRATKDKCGEFFVNLADNTLKVRFRI